MISKKDTIMEIDDGYISGCSYRKRHLFSNINVQDKRKEYNLDIVDRNNIRVNLKNKNVYIIVEGEEVYIKLIHIPKVDKKNLNDTVKNELSYCLSNMKNTIYTYTILRENETSQELLVFCLNNEKLSILENSISSSTNIKAVYLIQFCFLNYFQRRINTNNFIFIFLYNNKLYFVACADRKMVVNNVYTLKDSQTSFLQHLDDFIVRYHYFEHCKELEKIYFANLQLEELIEIDKVKLDCEDFGIVDKDEIFKSITINR